MTKSIIYKAKEDKDIQEDLRKLRALQQEPCEDAVPMSVIEEIKAEIRHFMFEVNPSSSESDYACNYIIDLINKKMGKGNEHGQGRSNPHPN